MFDRTLRWGLMRRSSSRRRSNGLRCSMRPSSTPRTPLPFYFWLWSSFFLSFVRSFEHERGKKEGPKRRGERCASYVFFTSSFIAFLLPTPLHSPLSFPTPSSTQSIPPHCSPSLSFTTPPPLSTYPPTCPPYATAPPRP